MSEQDFPIHEEIRDACEKLIGQAGCSGFLLPARENGKFVVYGYPDQIRDLVANQGPLPPVDPAQSGNSEPK